MEYVDGVSLSRQIADGKPLAPLQVLDFMLEMLGILDYLHTRVPPILHRDIKPANVIMRPDGAPVLVDFGAVRNVFRAPGESGSTVVGTYGYMPYEQYMGQASPASDLYALGATFLHLVTGRPPSDFMSEEGRLAVPAELPVDEPMRGVIAQLLEASPARRYSSARVARQALLASPTRPPAVPGTALVPAGSTALVTAESTSLSTLEPAPRQLSGLAAERYDRLAYSMWQMMEPTQSPDDAWGLVDVLAVVFFSTVTAGILPAVFLSVASARRRRLRRFFREGTPAAARIIEFRPEDIAFGAKLTRVKYEFEADGRTRRGSDLALPYIADRWREGEVIEILHIPARGYDSVIVSAE
jgi:hypothetical protein